MHVYYMSTRKLLTILEMVQEMIIFFDTKLHITYFTLSIFDRDYSMHCRMTTKIFRLGWLFCYSIFILADKQILFFFPSQVDDSFSVWLGKLKATCTKTSVFENSCICENKRGDLQPCYISKLVPRTNNLESYYSPLWMLHAQMISHFCD